MSGIAGCLDFNHHLKNQLPIFEKMLKSMHHRGPDHEEMILDDHLCFMQTQLFLNQQQSLPLSIYPYTVIFDGEFTNAFEIRELLEHHGIGFDTFDEAEIIVKAYAYYKEKCFSLFKGSFAIALYDEVLKECFLARDFLGIKPLFYAQINQMFIFSSEIKTLLIHPLVQPLLDQQGIQQIAYLGPGHISGTTFFKNIFEVKPSSFLIIHQEGCESHEFPSFSSHIQPDSLENTLQQLRSLLPQAVNRQLRGNRVGCFLSGGLDSSIITALASTSVESLSTFSIAYEDNASYFHPTSFQPSNDEDYVDIMSHTFKTHHTKIVLSPQDLIDSLYKMVDILDVPGMVDIDSALFIACKEVKKEVDIILSGECADEFFGGYPWYQKPLDPVFPWSKQIELRQNFLLSQYQVDPYPYIQELILNTIDEIPKNEDCCEDIQMKQMTYLNLRWFMQTLLDRQDRMTSAHELQARVPFCDVDLCSYVFFVPWHLKNMNNQEKGLLRLAMKDILPKEILERKKSPFPKTYHPLYLKALRKELARIIENNHEPLWQIFNREQLKQLLTQESDLPFYGQLMTTPQTIGYYLQINYWLKKYKIKIV